MKPYRMRGTVLAILIFASLLSIVPASAGGDFSASGRVTDPLGAPLARVRIEVGSQVAFTDSDGDYHIDFTLPGSYSLYLARRDLIPEYRSVSPSVLEPHVTLDVTLYYHISASSSPSFFVSLPQTITITATSWAPADSCVWAAEDDNRVQLSYVETLPDTSVRYTGQFTVSEETTVGWHYIQITAMDCVTDASRGRGTTGYRYSPSSSPPPGPDTTPPVVTNLIPKPGHVSTYDRDLGASPDGSTMVIHSVYFRVNVTDSRGVKSVYFELFDHEGKLTWNCTALRRWPSEYVCDEFIHFYSGSTYTFRVTATDPSNNQIVQDLEFTTNGGPIERERLVEL